MRAIWALDGMLDYPKMLCMNKDEFQGLIGVPPNRLHETEIRKACRVLGRFITWTISDRAGSGCFKAANEHLLQLLAMEARND